MAKWYQNKNLWCVVAGAAGVILGKKILTADCTRKACVSGLATGMKLQADAKKNFQSMKDEASDMCYDAKVEAGIEETETEETTEE